MEATPEKKAHDSTPGVCKKAHERLLRAWGKRFCVLMKRKLNSGLKAKRKGKPIQHHPYHEAWWWQHHVMGMLFSGRDWKFVCFYRPLAYNPNRSAECSETFGDCRYRLCDSRSKVGTRSTSAKFLNLSIFIRLTWNLNRICTFGRWIQLSIIFEVNNFFGCIPCWGSYES